MSSDVSTGSLIYSAVRPIFKVYFILGSGYYLARKDWLSVETLRNLSNMVLILFMPCMVVHNVITYIEDSDIKEIGIIVLSAVLMYSTGFLFAFLTSFVLPVPKRWRGGYMVGATLPNVSDLPIAYVQTMAGGVIFTDAEANKGVAYIIIYLATYIIVQFTCGLFRLIEWDFREIPEDSEKQLSSESSEDEKDTTPTTPPTLLTSSTVAPPLVPTIVDEQMDPNEDLISMSTISSVSSDGTANAGAALQVVALADTTTSIPRRRPRRASISSTRSGRSMRSNASSSSELVREYSRLEPTNTALTATLSIITENVSTKTIKESGAGVPFIDKYHLHFLVYMLKNFLKPASMALVFSLTMAMIPWCKALFVETSVYMPLAPDKLPPLAFVIDFASYLGQAAVPLGLLLLGSTIARLEVNVIPKHFWQCALALTAWRLIVMPIWGVLWVNRLEDNGWITDNKLLCFVIMLQWSLPSATVQVYLTASYSDPESESHLQMDCLAIYVIAQYSILFITLPITISYAIKVNLGY